MFCLKLINRINIFLIEQIKDRFQVAMNIMIFQFHRARMHSCKLCICIHLVLVDILTYVVKSVKNKL